MAIPAIWNTGSGIWFVAANWDEPNPNPPPLLLHYVPGTDNDVNIPDQSGIGTPFTITYGGVSTISTLASTRALTMEFQTGSLTIDNGGGTGVFLENGIFNVDAGFVLTNNAGTLSFNGGTLAGTLAGSGTFRFINGTFDLEAGLSMTVANWLLTYQIGSGTVSTTNLNTDLTYGGNFTIDAPFGNAAILNLDSHTLTLTGTSALGGNIVGPGTLRILGDATFAGASYTGGVLLQIAKTVTQTGSASQAGGYGLLGTLRVDAGASYTITAASNIDSIGVANQALVVNNGSFADNGVSANASRLDVGFTNGAGATLSVAAGATLKLGFADFRGTTDSLYNGAITGAGRLWLSGNSSLNTTTLTVGAILAGDTTTIARNLTYGGQFTLASFATLELGNRTLALSGTSNFTTGFNTIDGPGTLRITGTSTFGDFSAGSGAAVTLRNSGAITQTGGIYLNNGSTLLNDAGRTYTLAGGDIALNGGSSIINNGTFLVTSANSASHSTLGGSFANAGTLEVAAGATLRLGQAGGSATLGGTVGGAGVLVLAGGAAVNTQIGTASLAVNGTTTLGVDLDYGGAFSFGMFGRINLAGHTLTLSGTAALTGGFNTIDGGGTLKVTGSATFDGFSVGATAGATLQNSGAITQTGSIYLSNGSTLLNDAGRTYTLAGGDIALNGGSSIINNGTFLVTSANSASHSTLGGSFANAGTLEVAAGATLRLGQAGGSATLGGTVGGAGVLVLAGGAAVNTQIATASLVVNGTTTLGLDMTYAGAFAINQFANLALNGRTMTLTGSVSVNGAVSGSAGVDRLIVQSALANLSGLQLVNWTSGTDILTIGGTNGADSIQGSGYGDSISGGNDDDTLSGGAGADSLSGGAGNDLFVVDEAGDLVTDSAGADTVQSSISLALTAGIEALVLTGAATEGTGNTLDNLLRGNGLGNLLNGASGNDTLDGGAGADTLQGALGADSLLGGEGADSLNGAGGADTMEGGAGDDAYVVDSADDVVTEAPNAGIDTVFAAVSFTLGAGVENLALTGGATLSGTGNGLANSITGNNAANALAGGGGNDSLIGLNGNDQLNGGSGADTMAGGVGSDRYTVDGAGDVLVELPDEGTDQVLVGFGWTLAEGFENLLLTGNEGASGTGNAAENRMQGNAGANWLSGLGGNDALLGGDGADTLEGGAGADALTGGAGADRFLFGSITDRQDKISDFATGVDQLAFASVGFGGLAPGALGSANFVAHGSLLATAAAGTPQFVYHTGQGVLLFDADGMGGVAALRLAVFSGAPALAVSDLIMV